MRPSPALVARALRRAGVAPLLPLFRAAGPVAAADLRRRRRDDAWADLGAPAPAAGDVLDGLAERELRSVLYLRLRRAGGWRRAAGAAAARVWPGQVACELSCEDVGPGLWLMHGFATIVLAERIGAGCLIFQQVTLGETRTGIPTLGDRVTVAPGAIVIGGITIGDDAVIGAGAVVTRDVPAGATVAGVPARVLAQANQSGVVAERS